MKAPGRLILTIALLAVLLAAPAAAFAKTALAQPALAQTAQPVDAGAGARDGVLVRVNGDAAVSQDETIATAVVVSGDLSLAGDADTVVVVDGTAQLSGATVGTLVVVGGRAELSQGTVISGDLWLPDSTLSDDGTGRIEGEIVRDTSGFARSLFVAGLLLTLGVGVVTLLGALVLAAIAPDTARAAGTAVRASFGRVVLAGVLFWLVLPIAAAFLLVTLVGTPTALALWLIVLPIVGFLGYLVSAIGIGHLVVDRTHRRAHPYAAAVVGTLILLVIGLIPVVGPIVGLVASVVGGSALVLLAWRSFRADRTVGAQLTAQGQARP